LALKTIYTLPQALEEVKQVGFEQMKKETEDCVGLLADSIPIMKCRTTTDSLWQLLLIARADWLRGKA
jgi:hypothetical protein